jgi:hypothetical protein
MFASPGKTGMNVANENEHHLKGLPSSNSIHSPLSHQRQALGDAGQHMNRSAGSTPHASPFKAAIALSPHRPQHQWRAMADLERSENRSPSVTPNASHFESAFSRSPLRPQQQERVVRESSFLGHSPGHVMGGLERDQEVEAAPVLDQWAVVSDERAGDGEPRQEVVDEASEPLLVRLQSATGTGCTNCLNLGSRSGRGVWSTRAVGKVEMMESHCVIEVRGGTTLPMLYVSITAADVDDTSTPKWLALTHAPALDEPFKPLCKPQVRTPLCLDLSRIGFHLCIDLSLTCLVHS